MTFMALADLLTLNDRANSELARANKNKSKGGVKMEKDLILLPVLIQVFLTVALYIYLAVAKSKATKLGLVNEDRRALYDDAWPENVLQINNCIRNQFEVPVLFYVLVFMLWMMGSVSIYVHVLSWLFVLSRIFHAYIHTGSNFVPIRRKIFMFGCLVVLALGLLAAGSILAR